jgi:hypothetical protein
MFTMGIDPGGTTGIAIHSDQKFTSFQLHALDVVSFVTGWLEGLRDGGVDPATIHINVERFMIGSSTHKKSSQPAAQELCAQLKNLAAMNGTWFRQYGASFTKTYTDKVLKSIHAYEAGKDHANDATRVLLCGLLLDDPRELQRILREGMPQPIEVDEV